MERVEISFSHGQMRQPGLWGKVIQANGGVYDYDNEKDMDLSVKGTTRTIVLPQMPEGAYLLFGFKGFHQAGMLTLGYILMQVKAGQQCDWQIGGHLARFEGKGVLLITSSETDLQPIYDALNNAKYAHIARLQDFLRREKKDTSTPKT